MKIFRSLEQGQMIQPAVLTLGVFDGLHVGHQFIMQRVIERARALSAAATVLTFDPHPRSVLFPESAPPLLQTLHQKLEGMERLGIDQVLILNFTREVAAFNPEEFVEKIVLARLKVLEIYIGHGFAFGRNRAGRIETLQRLGEQLGFHAGEVGEVRLHGHRISSTLVRKLLAAGNVNLTRKMMGRPYGIEGTVEEGRRLGQTLSFPTANLRIQNSVIPANGVYVTLALVGDQWHRSVTNIGVRPTVGEQIQRSAVAQASSLPFLMQSRLEACATVETHLLDFSGDLYARVMRLRFMHRLREERKFNGLDELKAQIACDAARARRYFAQPLVRRHFDYK